MILSYRYKLSTPLGLEAGQSADYIFMGGFTSGNPDVINKPTSPGSGFTYKFSTTRDKTINTYFVDAKDSEHFNKPLNFDDAKVYVQPTKWNLLQMNLAVNNFSDRTPNENGSVTLFYNGEQVKPNQSTINNRVQIDATHDYDLNVLFEFYRHHKNKIDADERLRAQTLQIRDLTVAWEDANAELPPPPALNKPNVTGYDHVKTVNIDALTGCLDLLGCIEDQLNVGLTEQTGKFKISPKAGFNTDLAVVYDEKHKINVLQTTIDAEVSGNTPIADKSNGLSFEIELPNGQTRHATFAYNYKLLQLVGYGNENKSPDYIYLGGFSSNDATNSGADFDYKLATNRYNKIVPRFDDAEGSYKDNVLRMPNEDGYIDASLSVNQWNLVQIDVGVNDFINRNTQTVTSDDSGSVFVTYNNQNTKFLRKIDQNTFADESFENRTQVDLEQGYDLSIAFDFYRYTLQANDSVNDLLKQTIQLTDITVAWNDEPLDIPSKPEEIPNLDELTKIYDVVKTINLDLLHSESGKPLLQAIEDQLNEDLSLAEGQFEIVPNWGFDDSVGQNLSVGTDENGESVLISTISQGVHKQTTLESSLHNGFSFIVKLPNGLTQQAAILYNYKLSKPVGTANGHSRDYIQLGGFGSGNPKLENNKPTKDGFIYKFTTERIGTIKTRFYDSTDGKFWNTYVRTEGTNATVAPNKWNLVQLDLNLNNFNGREPIKNGFATVHYENKLATTNIGNVENRIFIDSSHNYSLYGLIEFYRHYLNSGSGDTTEHLLEQQIQIKDLTFAWNNTNVALPPPMNACSEIGFEKTKILDLSKLMGISGQELIDAITQQLGENNSSSTQNALRNNMEVVNIDGEYALKVNYPATLIGNVENNGTNFEVEFPLSDGKLGACMAYDFNIQLNPRNNEEHLILPGFSMISEASSVNHRYETTKWNKMSSKFAGLPALSNYGSTNAAPIKVGVWNSIQQSTTINAVGIGHVDYLLNGDSYFAPIEGTPYNEVQHQFMGSDQIGDLKFVTTFDTYRNYLVGHEDQSVMFKNIVIGWQ